MRKVLPALTATLIACASFLSADTNQDNSKGNCPEPQGCCPEKCCPAPAVKICFPEGIAPCARPVIVNSCGQREVQNGAIIDIELLVWQAHTDDLEVGVLNSNATGHPSYASQFTNASYQHMKFKWDAGVRLGVGYIFDHDCWDVYAAWTHFTGNASKDVVTSTSNTPSQTLFPTWSAAEVVLGTLAGDGNLTATSLDSHWKLKLDLIDLELGREFFAGRHLAVRPHVGLRGGWIKQNFDIQYAGLTGAAVTTAFTGTLDDIEMKNDFKGIGVRTGLDTEWNVGCGFCFFGDAAISILYGRYNISQQETVGDDLFLAADTVILSTTDSFNDSKAITDLALGIRWCPDMSCWCTASRLLLSAGWEHHMFFNQEQLKRVSTVNTTLTSGINTDNYTTYVREAGDLSTQGVTISLRWEY